jgi:hypothetical protein
MAVPWTVWTEGWDAQLSADDLTFCVAFDDGDERGFVVFDDEGLLREMLVLIGPPGLSDVDEAFLHDFVTRRCELRDPTFALFVGGDIAPMAGGPRAGIRELQYWSFQPLDVAPDGSRTVLVQDLAGYETLVVIDRDGVVIDGLPMDERSYGDGYHQALHRLQTSRRLAADPAFGVWPDVVWPWETDCDEL